jgi:hypothetical protein
MQHCCLSAEISGLQVRVMPGSPLSCKDLANFTISLFFLDCGDFCGDSYRLPQGFTEEVRVIAELEGVKDCENYIYGDGPSTPGGEIHACKETYC